MGVESYASMYPVGYLLRFDESLLYAHDVMVRRSFAKMKNHPYCKLVFGGLILSSLIFLLPSLYGEGYSAVNVLLKGQNEAEWGQVMNRSLFQVIRIC